MESSTPADEARSIDAGASSPSELLVEGNEAFRDHKFEDVSCSHFPFVVSFVSPSIRTCRFVPRISASAEGIHGDANWPCSEQIDDSRI